MLSWVGESNANPTYFNTFTGKYPAWVSPTGDDCDACHTGANNKNTVNVYGDQYREPAGGVSGFTSAPFSAARLTEIEPLDADTDGTSNLNEINNNTLPGVAAPQAVDDAAAATAGQQVSINVTQNDVSPQATINSIGLVSGPANGTAQVSGLNILYTPNVNFSGPTDTFTYNASSDGGTGNTATVTVTVTPVPPVAVDDTASVQPGNSVTINVTANDVGGGTPTSVAVASAPTNGTAVVNGLNIVYTPNPGFSGPTDTFTYTASNAAGTSNVATVTVSVNPGVPIANDDTASVQAGSSVTINVTANDGGGPPTSVAVATPPTNGTAVVNGLNIVYTPNPGFTGPTDTFTYTATNSGGTSNAATVTVTVNPASPIANNDTASVQAGSSVTIGVTANDGGGLATSVAVASSPANGTATVNGLNIVYTPNPGFTGVDSFTYTATNSAGTSNAATVTVTVNPATPIANNDTATVAVNGSVSIKVTANDTGGAPTSVAVASPPTNGTATVVGLEIVYKPNAGFTGPSDSFTYTAINSAGTSNAATVTVTVDAVVTGQNFISNNTTNPALKPVAASLDNVCSALASLGSLTPNQQDLLANCSNLSLDSKNGVPVDSALSGINNATTLAATDTSIQIAQTNVHNVSSRLDQIRSGRSGGISAGGLNASFDSVPLPLFRVAGLLLEEVSDASFNSEEIDHLPWGIFINGGFSLGTQDPTSREPGFDFDTMGITIGGDYRFSNQLTLGGAFTFSNTSIDHSDQVSNIDVNGRSFTVYGFFSPIEKLYLEGQVGYGKSNYESERNISFISGGVPVNRLATASYDGTQFSMNFAGSYDYVFGQVTISPTGEISYLNGNVDAYSETGAGGLNLAVSEQDFDSFFLSLGGRANYSLPTGFGKLVPEARIEYNHEFLNDTRTVTQNFVSAPTGTSAFEIKSDDPDRNFFTLGLAIRSYFGKSASAFLDYSTLVGLDDVENHTFTAGFEINF